MAKPVERGMNRFYTLFGIVGVIGLAAIGYLAMRGGAPISVPVLADARHLRRALTELVDNGHMHGATPVRMIFEADDDTATITIADGGPGIPERNRDHVRGPSGCIARDCPSAVKMGTFVSDRAVPRRQSRQPA